MKILVNILFFSLLISRIFISVIDSEEQISYFNRPFDEDEITGSIGLPVSFPDSVIQDSIYIHFSKENIPLAYSCTILTAVCSDNECLPIDIEIFWEPTGTYLGFRLAPGKRLTKIEHIPFSADEYSKLNKILAKKQSVLLNYKLKELVMPNEKSKEVDGISSATVMEVKDEVISGAVYTCFQLWHIVNGPISSFISENTSKIMTPEIVIRLIDDNSAEEIVWILDHVDIRDSSYLKLKQKLVKMMNEMDYSISFRIRNCLTPEDLNDTEIQHSLLDVFISADPIVQREIVQTLDETNQLEEKLFKYFSENLPEFNSNVFVSSLQLLSNQDSVDPVVQDYISELLKSNNQYLARKAWLFVEKTSAFNKKSQELKKKYQSKFQ